MSKTSYNLNYQTKVKLKKDILDRLKKEKWMYNDDYLDNKEYINCVYDILDHPKFQEMNKYIQHGNTSTLEHCLCVSYLTYKICRSYRLDYRSAARGALLHDLFLYDWHTHRKETGNKLHGLTHPRSALNNAVKYFDLNEKEQDIILKHMWPITVIVPKSIEGFIVAYVDKYCGFMETAARMKGLSSKFKKIIFIR